LADYLYFWETTVVRQTIDTARIYVSSGGHSSIYWCQQRQISVTNHPPLWSTVGREEGRTQELLLPVDQELYFGEPVPGRYQPDGLRPRQQSTSACGSKLRRGSMEASYWQYRLFEQFAYAAGC
jgi:hypothetical protein